MNEQTVDTLSPEKPSQNPRKTFDQGPTQSFFDFSITTAEHFNRKSNQKYDLSEPFTGIVLTSQEVTYDQLRSRTSDSFTEHIVTESLTSGDQTKVYEFYVFIKALADYYKTISINDLELYTRLKAVVSSKNPSDQFPKKDLDVINNSFKTSNEKIKALSQLEETIKAGMHRFYSTKFKAQSDYMIVSVKFFDKNQLEYGQLIENITTNVNIPSLKNLQRKIREFKTSRKYEKMFEESDKSTKAKKFEDQDRENAAGETTTTIVTGLEA